MPPSAPGVRQEERSMSVAALMSVRREGLVDEQEEGRIAGVVAVEGCNVREAQQQQE